MFFTDILVQNKKEEAGYSSLKGTKSTKRNSPGNHQKSKESDRRYSILKKRKKFKKKVFFFLSCKISKMWLYAFCVSSDDITCHYYKRPFLSIRESLAPWIPLF